MSKKISQIQNVTQFENFENVQGDLTKSKCHTIWKLWKCPICQTHHKCLRWCQKTQKVQGDVTNLSNFENVQEDVTQFSNMSKDHFQKLGYSSPMTICSGWPYCGDDESRKWKFVTMFERIRFSTWAVVSDLLRLQLSLIYVNGIKQCFLSSAIFGDFVQRLLGPVSTYFKW